MNNNFDLLVEYFPVLLPVIAVELTLAITALVHVIRHPHYKFGNKVVWIFVVLFIQFIGPIVYFLFGRGEE
ncbi:PLD nuclease N-terminal domain-containing protein [Bariatricus massiliensis]|uniref:PLD nuclease N-terminal domain-containing protein n=1 Tax=Bariatricus massiliensis TaxID=1745713 RepID=A0ABS8DE12_9FIRM|nr:PLD nuclease N-terminal domain-containing protein [Bariatricus massiliensis]MCB7303540.1 PLD nuclease N-terminal domain-containing protein [Bariatricus massiliensis]MCB7373672.1 PLD nuclease N-terminal domain-containing protein [Bariatricus massiliensis]MCB7386342.1 PLD nuclease N-terminal domain-containing protein [Bariatricus massiliensis]MCB7410504.1 PLD nuclease N-terminal domain-containing protein [Bariatricus massiliensis]MCQ5252212.1 PLD nuclease N-terminal domain-containing protein 